MQRQMERYGAERVEDQEHDGHHACMCIAFAVEDLDGVVEFAF